MSKPANPFLSGKKVTLMSLSMTDPEGSYYEWFNDTEVCKYNSHGRFPYTRNKCIEYIHYVENSSDNIVLAVCLKESGKHVGNVSLQNINCQDRNAEFAIIIGDASCWGTGVATEASSLIISHGFQQLNLFRVYCGTSHENISMQNLAKRLRFQQEGVRRKAFFKNESYHDIFEYGLLKSDFKNGANNEG
jgi:RimJ/RimL family protein N-acetyltransferase